MTSNPAIISFATSAGAIFPSAVVVISVSSPFPLRYALRCWQGQRASNPQPSVLETDALPIELCPCAVRYRRLFDDLRHDAGADGLAALADGKAQALLHRD